MEGLAPMIVSLAVFASAVLSFYFYMKARHTERMALIEKGLYSVERKAFKLKTGTLGLKLGSLSIGLGLGLFFGFLLSHFTIVDEDASYSSMIFLFGGLSLVANYIFESKKNKTQA
jgi:hypothetical protein